MVRAKAESDDEAIVTIAREGQNLLLRSRDGQTEELYAVSHTESSFAAGEIIAKVVFVEDSACKVSQFMVEIEGESYTAVRI